MFADSIVKETFRLYSGVVMVRIVGNETTLELQDGSRFRFHKDDKVAVYPPAIHMDPDIYEEPKVRGPKRLVRYLGTTFYSKLISTTHRIPFVIHCILVTIFIVFLYEMCDQLPITLL